MGRDEAALRASGVPTLCRIARQASRDCVNFVNFVCRRLALARFGTSVATAGDAVKLTVTGFLVILLTADPPKNYSPLKQESER